MAGLRLMALMLLGALLLASPVKSQDPVVGPDGDEICSCAPTVFRFTLDFMASCPGSISADDDGIADVSCDVVVLAQDQSNPQPVIVDTINVLELNDNAVINSTILRGPFRDGDTIEYASISSYRNLTETYFPFGLHLTLNGDNSDLTDVINVIAIDYDTSACDEWPWYEEGSTSGWVKFGTVQDAFQLYCPSAPAMAATITDEATTTSTVQSTTTTTEAATTSTTVFPSEGTTTLPPQANVTDTTSLVDETTTEVAGGDSTTTDIPATTTVVEETTTTEPPVTGGDSTTSDIPAATDTTADPGGPIATTTTAGTLPTAAPVASTIAPTIAPVAGGTDPPSPVAGPTLPPVSEPPAPDQPTPEDLSPTIDSPTSDLEPLAPASESVDQ